MSDTLLARVEEQDPYRSRRYAETYTPPPHELPEEEQEDKIERDRLITENQKLVYSFARKHMGQGIELSDLIQIGNLGLLKAVQKFDPTKGVQFSSYAFYWIQQTIMLALKNQSRIIRIPTHILDQIKRYYHAHERLSHKLGRDPSSHEIAQELYSFEDEIHQDRTRLKEGTLTLDDLVTREDEREKKRKFFHELEEVLQIAQVPLSLDEPCGEDESCVFVEAIAAKEVETPEETCMKKYMKQELHWLLSYLSERERNVVKWRFGIDDDEPLSFQDIAGRLSITKQGARKILMTTLAKLRRLSESIPRAPLRAMAR
ncbi:MAG: RNA polymerase sigma factor RpoD/SigA [Candidatus Eremiobacteraeota bacterium]|nr:RNA polymerase sigma factor RpoD/SigA [Candidatus Eremiobacteraeota bacterium]